MKILVIEDEHRIATSIKKGLEQERFVVDVAYDGEEGYDLAASESYDVIVLDVMLPKLDGFAVCKKLREDGNHTPVLMLTAKGQVTEKVEGFEAGADDYLVKPFAFAELIARLKALMRRPSVVENTRIEVGDIVLDTKNFTVMRQGKPIVMTKKEFTLLTHLMKNQGKVITKESIIRNVWDYESDVLDNTVEVYIRTLRRKLGRPDPIKTVRGFGYILGSERES